MTYKVLVTSPARRDLNRLPEAVAAAIFEFISGPLAENPHRVGHPLGEDRKGQYAARRGSYRVIYRIMEEAIEVHVIRIRHRATAYHSS